ncbi:methionyl-tRNA formyltransferase [Saprospiraceae bacterium]|nr:methionyl-tRNA formyltransferase [Saprospiraceae bacterium]
MKIIYMGTPEFAVPSLEVLYNAGYDIVGVITSVDKYGGRGRKKLIESAVKKYAVSKNLNILQPPNLKSPKFIEELKALKADLQIVVAFRMLPVVVWDMPPLGTYNLHGSLLPKYRGAAPINWAIINGEKKTGVTSFKLKHEIDTGSILLQKTVKIYQDDNATALHNRMMYHAADTVYKTVKKIENGDIELKEQFDAAATHAPKLNKENTQIDFSKTVTEVYDFIRGLSLYPCAWFNIDGKLTKVYEAEISRNKLNHTAGTIITDNKSTIHVACKDGYVALMQIQMSGKSKMKTKDFLNGYNVSDCITDN